MISRSGSVNNFLIFFKGAHNSGFGIATSIGFDVFHYNLFMNKQINSQDVRDGNVGRYAKIDLPAGTHLSADQVCVALTFQTRV